MRSGIIIGGVDVAPIMVGPATFVIHQPDADRLPEAWAGGKSVLGEFAAQGTAEVTYTKFGRWWLKRAGLLLSKGDGA